ncbi:hypothetical protein [Priestia megaterium]|nr:hypothetical protein [Priestia megaterium]MED4102161.1 hypothetical protein [Priestia megaterium]MED4142588.1 hypothetical protein [Priestia megaterium]
MTRGIFILAFILLVCLIIIGIPYGIDPAAVGGPISFGGRE